MAAEILAFETNETPITKKPTLEEYEAALKNYKSLNHWIKVVRARKDELLDVLSEVRADELRYIKSAEEQYETIRRYEIYERMKEEEIQ